MTKERRVREWRSEGGCRKGGEKESGSLAEAFMPEVCAADVPRIICYLPRESSLTQIGLFLAALNASQ